MIGNRTATKTREVSKNSQQNNSETVEHDKEIPKEKYLSPDERQKNIDEVWYNNSMIMEYQNIIKVSKNSQQTYSETVTNDKGNIINKCYTRGFLKRYVSIYFYLRTCITYFKHWEIRILYIEWCYDFVWSCSGIIMGPQRFVKSHNFFFQEFIPLFNHILSYHYKIMIYLKIHLHLTIPVHDSMCINCIWGTDYKTELMKLMFPLLKGNFLSRGSNGMITTLAQWHCACTKFQMK